VKTVRNFLQAVLAGIASLAMSVLPVAFIHRGFSHLLIHWQEIAFFVTVSLLGLLSTMLGFALISGNKETVRQRKLVWFSIVFFLLYVASAALCEKLKVGIFAANYTRTFGVVLVIAGSLLRLTAVAYLRRLHSGFVTIQSQHRLITGGPYKLIRHPSYLGALIFLIGIPLTFGAWFPLLAIPGVMVGLKWRINDEEALLNEHFGSEYQQYQEKTWRLLPYIY